MLNIEKTAEKEMLCDIMNSCEFPLNMTMSLPRDTFVKYYNWVFGETEKFAEDIAILFDDLIGESK